MADVESAQKGVRQGQVCKVAEKKPDGPGKVSRHAPEVVKPSWSCTQCAQQKVLLCGT